MRAIVWVLGMALVVPGCGGSEQQQQQEQAAEAAKSGAEQAAKGLEQMAKGLEQLAGGGDGKPVPPVNFRELQTLFPDLSGWEKGKPVGEMMTMPVSFSQAEVEYTKGEAAIEMKIIDTGLHQLLLAPYSMFLTAGYERETQDGYEKSVSVAGQPGWERWNSSAKDGALNAVVGKRFLVTLEGRNIDDTKVLHDVLGQTDIAKLSTLR
jgi:X-X-X-Leu-X-X-Gly heptad repeat protein